MDSKDIGRIIVQANQNYSGRLDIMCDHNWEFIKDFFEKKQIIDYEAFIQKAINLHNGQKQVKFYVKKEEPFNSTDINEVLLFGDILFVERTLGRLNREHLTDEEFILFVKHYCFDHNAFDFNRIKKIFPDISKINNKHLAAIVENIPFSFYHRGCKEQVFFEIAHSPDFLTALDEGLRQCIVTLCIELGTTQIASIFRGIAFDNSELTEEQMMKYICNLTTVVMEEKKELS